MLAKAGVSNPELESAFSEVKREMFLGDGPWIAAGRPPQPFPTHAALVYQDILFVLKGKKGINNGEPSLHCRLLNALKITPGSRVAHLGAGTGYYSAILSELVGSEGHVLAVESEPDLANVATTALSNRANVEVRTANALDIALDEFDLVYVNFAVEHIPPEWLACLATGGRALIPFGIGRSMRPGGPRVADLCSVFMFTKTLTGIQVDWISKVMFVCAEGDAQTDAEYAERLRTAFVTGHPENVKSLIVGAEPAEDQIWLRTEAGVLSYLPLAEGLRETEIAQPANG